MYERAENDKFIFENFIKQTENTGIKKNAEI
jgi:hypothetical protein